MLDFYTIETPVDLTKRPEVVAALVQHIGYFCQPEIIGKPYGEPIEAVDGDETEETFFLRFAVRHNGLLYMESDFIDTLKMHFLEDVTITKMRDL